MDIEFAKELASLGDIYVNDAFAVSHHPSVSVSVLPTILRPYAGLLLDSEIIHLTRAMEEPAQPLVVVVAGGKAVDKFAVIKNLYKAADKFLVGGILGNSFLKDRGVDVGSSHVDPEITNQIHELLHDPKIIVPEDWIADEAGTILDMGPISRKKFAEVLIKAKTVIWNGPLGKFEDPRYRAGSRAVADAIIASGAFSVVGGGETTQFLLEEKLADDFTFLSTGGGAMLDYLAGKDLPGITVLR